MDPKPGVGAVHRALTLSNGNREDAAESLGVSIEILNAIISESSDLRVYWGGDIPPTAIDSITRSEEKKERVMTVSPEVLKRSTAVFGEMTKFNITDWEGMGVKDTKTIGMMRQFEGDGAGRSVLRLMDTMQGGMAYCFARTSRQFADVADALETEMSKQDADNARVLILHTRFKDLADMMRQFSKEVSNAANIRLMIADRARRIQKAGDKMRKPGWRGPNMQDLKKAQGAA